MKQLLRTLWIGMVVCLSAYLCIPSLPAEAAVKTKKKVIAKVKKSRAKKAKKSRRRVPCNVTVGRMQALAYLQSSKEIAALAMLEYKPDPNLRQFIETDGEDLSDSEGFNEEHDVVPVEREGEGFFKADVKTIHKLWLSYMRDLEGNDEDSEESRAMIAHNIYKKDVMNHIMGWIGTPYYYGGNGRSGIDCSAFTLAVFKGSGDITLPRTAAQQSTVGELVKNQDLRFGDLVFFNTRKAVYVSHVGLYLGDNLFAHASSRYGVTVSSLMSDYYRSRFLGAKRLRPEDVQVLSAKRGYSASQSGSGKKQHDSVE